MNEIPISSLNRIANQYEVIFSFIKGSTREKIMQKPPTGKWSIHENLAHVARYQEVFIDRIHAILQGDNPAFERYDAARDPVFAKWTAYSTEDILMYFKDMRRKIFNLLIELKPEQSAKKGRHPRFGEMNVIWWTEFFLLHESQHLMTIYALLCESTVKPEHAKK